MDIRADYGESVATSMLSYRNVSFGKAEDSGYHTLTPGSLECAELSNEDLDHSIISNKASAGAGQLQIDLRFTPDANIHLCGRYSHSTGNNDSLPDTPPFRRGCKRPHSSTEKIETNSVPTPTSFIAGKIQSLDVNEIKENAGILSQVGSLCSDNIRMHLYHHDYDQSLAYPSTPVKRNCKRNSCRKPGAALSLTIHSLSCESNGLQKISKSRALSKATRNIFWPDQKIDIIQKLYQEAGAMPPITKILSFLSNEDITNFTLVSNVWQKIWESVSDKNKRKQNYDDYLKTVKGNQENKDKGITPKVINQNINPGRCLREIQNVVTDPLKGPGTTPPASPRTNRFRKFTKSASLDSRVQLSCVRCCQPAKVTEETSGEVWVECTSQMCLYQYCKFCKCNRHPGKFCFQYDLNGPSPSKRKKNLYAVGTKKSRRNLLRL